MKLSKIFREIDIALEQFDDHVTILANDVGRDVIQHMVPETPIDWKNLSGLPSTWRWIEVVPTTFVDFCGELLRAECRMCVKKGDGYKFLRSESDIQKIRPQ